MDNTNYHHGNLKKDLIEHGLIIINSDGFEGLSLRKVAKACGVSHAAPYKHFKSKDDLIEGIREQVMRLFIGGALDAPTMEPNLSKKRTTFGDGGEKLCQVHG